MKTSRGSAKILGFVALGSVLTIPVVQACRGALADQRPRQAEQALLTHAPEVPPPIQRNEPAKLIVNLETSEVTKEIAEGVEYTFWTFGGEVPGKFIRVREGDEVEFHLNNHPDSRFPHNIDLQAAQELTFGGQIRPRFEFRMPGANEEDVFTSMRARAQLRAALERNVSLFFQIQDVRLWGEETSTLTDFSADNLDLHQGYLEVSWGADVNLRARVGRQVTAYGGERLIGAVEWTQQGRAFDGFRLNAAGPFGSVDVFGFKLAEGDAPGIVSDAEVLGAYAQIDGVAGGAIDLYTIFNRVGDPAGTKQATVGARLAGRGRRTSYRFEGSYQLGTRDGLDASAFMLGARVGRSFLDGRARLVLWYDYLSGDDDPADGRVNVFETLFATNHKFYGFADLFLNIPAHTGGLGLQDAAIKASFDPIDDLQLSADLHSFHLAKEGALSTRHLGEEIDFTARYRYSPNLTATAGISHVIEAAALRALGRLAEDMMFAYVMLDASL